MLYSAICDTGLVRLENQDSVFSDTKGSVGCFCVADGMGGHENGGDASREIVESIKHWWEEVTEPTTINDFMDMPQGLSNAIKTANDNIRKMTAPGSVCGSTVVCVLVWQTYYAVLHAGDSRAYLINKRYKLNQITRDDVWENQPNLNIRKSKLKKYTTYGKLVNAIGARDDVSITIKSDMIESNIGFLLCSDGLYKMVDEKNLRRILRSTKKTDLNQTVDKIKQVVYENGARDNVSIILIRV